MINFLFRPVLRQYSDDSFIMRSRVRYLLIFSVSLIILLIVLTIAMFAGVSAEAGKLGLYSLILVLLGTVITTFLLYYKKYTVAALLFSLILTLIVLASNTGEIFTRSKGIVTMSATAHFMQTVIVTSALFCPRWGVAQRTASSSEELAASAETLQYNAGELIILIETD